MTLPVDAVEIKKITDDAFARRDASAACALVRRARDKKGLTSVETAQLCAAAAGGSSSLDEELYASAAGVKREIYGERLVFFAPLYLSDNCVNDCEYCGFHSRRADLKRTSLSRARIAEQTSLLLNMGHKRILAEAGESGTYGIDDILAAIETIYSVKSPQGGIRRVNVNVAATSTENYKKLKSAGIGTYQLFQETYDPGAYSKVHPRGPKSDYLRQITAHDRAFAAGIDDVGLGVLFGLSDPWFETVALVGHARYLEKKFGAGPHTISVPRFRPAEGVDYVPDYPVSDEDFIRIIAILRLAVPYTGLIISTRERPDLRARAFKTGISQASAASSTGVGGYSSPPANKKTPRAGQFAVCDERTLSEVISSVLPDGFMPSFCTACYRRGRTGEKFMKLAKPAEIHNYCRPNAIITFAEYLEDFASGELYAEGNRAIEEALRAVEPDELRRETLAVVERVRKGARDIYF